MRDYVFSPLAFKQLGEWIKQDKKLAQKIIKLAEEIARNPFDGIGKPEALKGQQYKGYWSRRITDEHRLIYKVDDDVVYVASCYGHYDDK